MVTKVIKPKKKSKAKGHRRIARLLPYVLSADKVGWVISDNLPEIRPVLSQMYDVASRSRRVKDWVYHFALSWPPKDAPTRSQMEAVIFEAIARLGLQHHQWIAVCHIDAYQPHVHVIVNRVHPVTYRAAHMGHDFWILDKLAREMELQFGWTRSNRYRGLGKKYRVGTLVVFERDLLPRRLSPSATRGVGRDGRLPFQEWLLDDPRAVILEALGKWNSTWDTFHSALARYGVRYEVGKRGGTLVDAFNPKFCANASHVGRFAALPYLERLLGAYQPPKANISKERAYSRTIANADPASLRPRELQKQYERETEKLKRENAAFRGRLRNEQRASERQRRTEIRATEKDLLKQARELPKTARDTVCASVKRDTKRQLERHKSLCKVERNRLRARLNRLPEAETWYEFVHRLAGNARKEAVEYLDNLRAARHRRFELPPIAVPLEEALILQGDRAQVSTDIDEGGDQLNHSVSAPNVSLSRLRAIAQTEESTIVSLVPQIDPMLKIVPSTDRVRRMPVLPHLNRARIPRLDL